MDERPAPSDARNAPADGLKLMGVTFAHCGLLARLHRLCFEDGWNSATVAQVLRLTGAFGLLATLPERTRGGAATNADAFTPVGFALVAGALDERELLSLGVIPAYRRRGVAGSLIQAVFDRVRSEGVTRLYLEVAEDNDDARRLYRSMGFEAIGRRPGYYARGNGTAVAAITLARVF